MAIWSAEDEKMHWKHEHCTMKKDRTKVNRICVGKHSPRLANFSDNTCSTYHFSSLRESSQQLHPWACLKLINPPSSAHMAVYVLLPAFFIHSLASSAISLLPTPSPPHPGAELPPRLAGEGDLHTVLLLLTWGCLFLLTLSLFDGPCIWPSWVKHVDWTGGSVQGINKMYSLHQGVHWLKDQMDHTRWWDAGCRLDPEVLWVSSALYWLSRC